MGARAIGEELELLFLDPVFHLPTGTIQIFVQGSRLPVLRSERGDDETGILPLGQIFGLAHHAPLAVIPVKRNARPDPRFLRRQLQPVERALPRQRLAPGPPSAASPHRSGLPCPPKAPARRRS